MNARPDLLERVLETAAELAGVLDLEPLLERTAERARQISGMERGCLVLREGDGLTVAAEALAPGAEGRGLPVAESLVRQAIQTGRAALAAVTPDGQVTATESMLALSLRSVLCVPLAGRQEVLGALYADSRFGAAPAGDRELAVLELLGAQAAVILENARWRRRLADEARRLKERLRRAYAFESLVGRSPAMQAVYRVLTRLRATDADVLVSGETGTGKELAARVIHFTGPRSGGPLVDLNCAALPEELVDAELFGIERRVATAVEARAGRVEQAEGGSLFLDEVGDLPLPIQLKLLRFLQDRRYRRVGGRADRSADVRVIAATNRDLLADVRTGRFRSELYYRLEAVQVRLPPLRERAGDAGLLAYHFLGELARSHPEIVPRGLTPAAEKLLGRHPWPGNVRQLQHVIRAAAVLGEEKLIDAGELRLEAGDRLEGPALAGSLPAEKAALTRQLLETALARHRGNVRQAAAELGIARKTLYEKARQCGLEIRRRPARGGE